MNRIRRAAAATTVALLIPLSACAGEATKAAEPTAQKSYSLQAATELPPAVQAIKDKGKLVVGVKFDQPLMGLKNPANGTIEGFDTEMGRLIATRIFGSAEDGKNIEFVETISKNREEYIKTGKVDVVIATYTINDARKKLVDFAGPYLLAGQDIMTKKSDTSINSLEELAGKKVCVAVGSNSLTNLQKLNPGADVSAPLQNYSACSEALRNGQYAAVSTDNVILAGFVSKDADAFRVVNKPFTKEPYGIAMKKDSTQLRAFVNDTLEEAFTSGDWKKAFESTLGKAGLPTPGTPTLDR